MEENTTAIAVDIAKTLFEIAVSDTPGRVSEHHRPKRAGFLAFFKNLSPASSRPSLRRALRTSRDPLCFNAQHRRTVRGAL
jgi:hypothetical protein